MRNTVKLYSVILLCAALSSCTPEEIFGSFTNKDDDIRLVASMPSAGTFLTKASGEAAYKGILNASSEISGGLAMGYLRIDQDSSDVTALTYTGATYAEPGKFSTKDYTYSKGSPHYYYSTANLGGNAYYRDVEFDILQYFKANDNAVTYYGWYPYGTPDATGAFEVDFDLDGRTDVLYSSAAKQIMNHSSDTLSMHHALCQYRIWVYRKQEVGDDESKGVGRWGRLTEIIARNQRNQATFAPPATISYSYKSGSTDSLDLKKQLDSAKYVDGVLTSLTGSDLHGVYYVRRESDSGVEHNGVTIPIGEDKAKKVACYMAPPPTDNKLDLRIITDATEGREGNNLKTLSVAGTYQSGNAYDIILCFSDHGVVNASVATGEWESYGTDISIDVKAKMYYDLSRYGTANCYIVSSGNVGYSFQGNVKGCGNDNGGGTVVGVEDCSLPDNSYIDILWQSSTDLIKLEASTLVDGKVLFWVPGVDDESDLQLKTKGNAIIAARKTKGGEILWSWHIWITDRPQDQGYLNGYDAMDRNIGALSGPGTKSAIENADTTSYGFYYQWGRKDPVIQGVTKWNTTENYSGSSSISSWIETGIKNPLTAYYHWNVDAMESIMGYRNAQDNRKSIYDPCPPGYRTPESEAFKTLSKYKTTAVTPKIAGGIFTSDDNSYIFYPDAGFVYASAGLTSGAYASRSWDNDENGEIYLYTSAPEDFIDGATGKICTIYNIPDSPRDYRTNQAASAFSMRCIATSSKGRVTDLCEAQTANCYIVPSFGAYKFRVDIKGNGIKKVNLAGSMREIYDSDYEIDLSTINHVAVLWWQGDVSGTYTNNTAGTDCPIKFVNDDKTLPKTPSHSSNDFGSSDITVPDEDGYVQFYINEKDWGTGNAVVAAFDDENEIIWSWHLWFTETPEVINMGPSTVDGYEFEYSIMDRNLGATYLPTSLSATDNQVLASIGLYYQWGRKDPLQGADALSTITGGSSTGTSTWYKRNYTGDYGWASKSSLEITEITKGKEITNPNTSIKNPTTFYSNTLDVHYLVDDGKYLFEKNWYSELFGWDYDLWFEIGSHTSRNLDEEDTYKFVGRWGYNTPNSSTALDPPITKTMYDPCPPGYFVPAHGILAAADLVTSVTEENVDKYDSKDFTWEPNGSKTGTSDDRGIFFSSSNYPITQNFWVPFGGYRDYQSGKFNVTHFKTAAVWYTASDYESRMYELQSGVRSVVITASGSGGILGQRPADAANVRCRAY